LTQIHSAAITGHSLLAALAIVVSRLRFAIRAKMQRQRFSFRAIPVVLETYVARPTSDEWSIPTAGICFAFELVNERRGLA
jgi:hypothetical protein